MRQLKRTDASVRTLGACDESSTKSLTLVILSLFLILSWSPCGRAQSTAIEFRNASYAATDHTTFKPHRFFPMEKVNFEIVEDPDLGPQIEMTISLPSTLIGNRTQPTTFKGNASRNGTIASSFNIYSTSATGYCQKSRREVSCHLSYVTSYLKTVDFNQAEQISRETLGSRPDILEEALASIQSFRFDPEGVLRLSF